MGDLSRRLAGGRGTLAGALLERLLRLANARQTAFTPGQFGRQLVASPLAPAGVFLLVDAFGRGQNLTRLAAQPALRLAHALPTHRLVFRGVGLHLRAVQRDPPDLQRAGFQRQSQHLFEQRLECLEMDLAKIREGAKVRPIIRRQDAKAMSSSTRRAILRDERTPRQ